MFNEITTLVEKIIQKSIVATITTATDQVEEVNTPELSKQQQPATKEKGNRKEVEKHHPTQDKKTGKKVKEETDVSGETKDADVENTNQEDLDNVFVVRRFFEQLTSEQGIQRREVPSSVKKRVQRVKSTRVRNQASQVQLQGVELVEGGVVYNTWNPLGDIRPGITASGAPISRAKSKRGRAGGRGSINHRLSRGCRVAGGGGRTGNDVDASDLHVHTGDIIFAGLLWKQGNRPNIWKERFFILRETGLSYFTHKDPVTIAAVKLGVAHEVEEEALEDQQPPVSPQQSTGNPTLRKPGLTGNRRTQRRRQKWNTSVPLIGINTIYAGVEEVENDSSNVNIFERYKKGPPRPRGNVFFVDVITPSGMIVDNLNWLQNSVLGNKSNAFLIQTQDSMFVLAANSPDQKTEWIQSIDQAYSNYVKVMIRKVVIMELSWNFSEELMKSKSKGTEESKGPGNAQKNRSLRTGPDTEAKPDPRGLFRRLMKKTLERTKRRILGHTAVDKQKQDNETEDERRIKKHILRVKQGARGSLSRMDNRLRVRLSTKRVDIVKKEAVQGLTDKFDEQLQAIQAQHLLKKYFVVWKYYTIYRKNHRERLSLQVL